MLPDWLNVTADPTYPWSTGFGAPALLLVAVLLIGLTIWTYSGVARTNPRRVFIVLNLRLLALFLAILAMVRPSLAARDDLKVPSVLIVLVDSSESMTISDAHGLTRWAALQNTLERSNAEFKLLEEQQNVRIVYKSFDAEVKDYDKLTKADGKRTHTGEALAKLAEEFSQERYLRGLLVFSDGADNGVADLALSEAQKLRRRSCPIHTFAFGQNVGGAQKRDIALVNIIPEPSPVPVKSKLNIKVVIDAPGFEGQPVPVELYIDDKKVSTKEVKLTKRTGNEVILTTDAPAIPGEIKVTVKVPPQIGEVIQTNNEIGTFVTVSKEGLSVLYVEGRIRAWEPTFIRRAMADPRIRLDEMLRLDDRPLTPAEAEVLRFDKNHYDVIILGDLTPRKLTGGDPIVLDRIRAEVEEKGTGLMMLGGFDSFGNSWKGTPLAAIMPVDMNEAGQVDSPIQMLPTRQGLDQYLMRLTDNSVDNEKLWSRLPKLSGMTRMGARKPDAVVLARANNAAEGAPLLVSRDAGKGRTLAFGGDETFNWIKLDLPKDKTKLGLRTHGRFWKQVALWLARQEEATGNVWIKPDTRRLAAGNKLGFSVGLRGKGGIDLVDARFTVKVLDPNKAEIPVPTSAGPSGERGAVTRTDQAGEYRILVHGEGKDADGQVIQGDTSVRFLVYHDTAELSQEAANPEFLARLASAGGGKALRGEDLPRFLQELRGQTLPQAKPKIDLYPDWRKNRLSPFIVGYFLLFVAVVSLEWFLRRSWGLV